LPMGDSQDHKPPLFLAPVMAKAMEPARQAIMAVAQAQLALVHCPRCGAVLAAWAMADGCLYHVTEDGSLGSPLSTSSRERVPVTCNRCQRAWQTSGRGIGRALHNGRPLLA
jgi:hypothetical protein